MWGEVSCLRKQNSGRDQVSNHQSSELKSNVLIITPLCLHKIDWWCKIHILKPMTHLLGSGVT